MFVAVVVVFGWGIFWFGWGIFWLVWGFLFINCEWCLSFCEDLVCGIRYVCHTQWCCLSFDTVPGIKAAPEHEMVAGMALLSFFAVEKQVWVCTFLLLLFLASVLLHRKRQQHRNHYFLPNLHFS